MLNTQEWAATYRCQAYRSVSCKAALIVTQKIDGLYSFRENPHYISVNEDEPSISHICFDKFSHNRIKINMSTELANKINYTFDLRGDMENMTKELALKEFAKSRESIASEVFQHFTTMHQGSNIYNPIDLNKFNIVTRI